MVLNVNEDGTNYLFGREEENDLVLGNVKTIYTRKEYVNLGTKRESKEGSESEITDGFSRKRTLLVP